MGYRLRSLKKSKPIERLLLPQDPFGAIGGSLYLILPVLVYPQMFVMVAMVRALGNKKSLIINFLPNFRRIYLNKYILLSER